jgi:hypothetical protein
MPDQVRHDGDMVLQYPNWSHAIASPAKGEDAVRQLAAEVRMLPLMPLGKKPPEATAVLLR